MSAAPSADSVVSTEGIVRSFGRLRVIDGVNLDVPRGRITGFLGRNGAGKTTMIRMLLGILSPDRGTITFEGQTVSRVTPAMRARIGYVAQEQHFYDWMDARALGSFVGGFYPTWSPSGYARALDRLAVPAGRAAGQMSGGTRMKLALALAIGADPALLVLDEPTAGVDPVTRREVVDLLRALVREEGKTVFFSTHYVAEIEDAGDRVGVLHQGKLLWQGPVDGLRSRVRRAQTLPEGARQLWQDERGIIAWAEPGAWGADAERIPLEDAFVALVRDGQSADR